MQSQGHRFIILVIVQGSFRPCQCQLTRLAAHFIDRRLLKALKASQTAFQSIKRKIFINSAAERRKMSHERLDPSLSFINSTTSLAGVNQ